MDTSYLTSQIATIIGELHGLFDEIGVEHHEREARESELFAALSETLHEQLRRVASEKHEMTEEVHRIIKTIKQMEASLDDVNASNEQEDEGLRVSFPLVKCLQSLKEKFATISKIHKERFDQVKKLVQALNSYASHLESTFVKITLPPTSPNASIPPTFSLSPSYVTSLDVEFSRVYEEYTRRVATVQTISEDIIKLWAELGTPQAQTDGAIVKYYRDSPEQLGLREDDLGRLKAKKDRLVEEKRGRERRLREIKTMVEVLWDRLNVEEHERKRFLNGNRGCGMRVINEFEDELSRLNELKRQNLHLFVEDARCRLQELWDGLYFSEEEMLDFTPAFSDVYSDALLSAHESEIARLEALKEQRAPTLDLIDKHRSLVKDRDDLTASSQDASRLMLRGQKGEKRDPTRLLREEKMRKRIAKELPKVEIELRKALERWENEYGRPFLVHGERYLDELAAAAAKAAPPRSKTPSGPPPRSKTPSAPPALNNKTSRPATAASHRNDKGATKVPPPPRSGMKTPTGTVRRIPHTGVVQSIGQVSPSRIPARAPLGNMQNSPERRGLPEIRSGTETIRKGMLPPKAPPPKMRDLFIPPAPTPVSNHYASGQRSASAASSSESVRHVTPEDVYNDRDVESQTHSSSVRSRPGEYRNGISQQLTPQTYHSLHSSASYTDSAQYLEAYYPSQSVEARRQISTTSSATNTVSGSENWETYDDASEPELDASEEYYAKLRAVRGKRFTPDDGYAAPLGGAGKKLKGIRAAGVGTEMLMEAQSGQLVKVSGSEAGWTDEEAF
ncbi:hypothetical protein FGG08_005001 [Glutinoglossum americanum]|uniref:Microtubule associated protein n=1 Tax=Glutinoglossum americanum TaxID=1670608 RepID=A0A9P8HZ30_9PEZI|nr:hypothetical protein FGG08_005001 [Glutinoglossum americanum]